MRNMKSRSIRRISVTKLFGMYDYELAVSDSSSETKKLLILYGDNGSGKTTILKLVFHLLAPEDNEGHKSKVAPVPFRRFEIDLHDNTKIWAARSQGRAVGTFSMGIKTGRKKERTVDFVVKEEFSVRPTSRKHDAQIRSFLGFLAELRISLYLLSDDRTLQLAGRDERRPLHYGREVESEWIYMEAETRLRTERHRQIDPEIIAQRLLAQSMRRTQTWIQEKTMLGSSLGESSVNALYNEILSGLISLPRGKKPSPDRSKKSIQRRVKELELQSKQFAKYGLLPEFSGSEIVKAVSLARDSQTEIITNVLNPYLKSLEKKLEALAKIHARVDSFVGIINRFLTNKVLTFDLHTGLTITAANGQPLDPAMLSSGERHLLLLFCNSLVAVDRPSIMMIDEPELSLNIKWQRKLLSSLLECIGDNQVQYVLATHSMELLVQHRQRVMKLENITKSKG